MSVLNSGTAEDAVSAKTATIERIANGAPPPPKPARLPVDQIVRIPEIFQPRSSSAQGHKSAAHVNDLSTGIDIAREVDKGAKMEPVLVFWVGDAWACLDGHHRLAAIDKKRRRLGGKVPTVAVEVFSGTVDAAMLESTRRNSRNKLPMEGRDKSERAWQLLLTGTGTHREISEVCGVATKTLQRMAKVLREEGSNPDRMEALRGLAWWQVLLMGRKEAEPGTSDRERARIERRAEVFEKSMGADSAETIAEVLMVKDPEFAKAVGRRIHALLSRAQDFENDTDDLPEFPEEETEGETQDF
jgi:hypothetical protein